MDEGLLHTRTLVGIRLLLILKEGINFRIGLIALNEALFCMGTWFNIYCQQILRVYKNVFFCFSNK